MKTCLYISAVLVLAIATIAQCPTGTPPQFTSADSTTFTEGIVGSFAVTASGTPTPTITESGTLPSGITFSAGSLHGTPAVPSAGVYPITFGASNTALPDASQQFTLTVVQAPPPSANWQPALNSQWNWQLSSTPTPSQLLPNSTNPYPVYDVDGFDAPASLVTYLHQHNSHAICYIDAGTWENWRSDASQFSAAVKGSGNGWPGEKWLDIRATSIRPIMQARFQMCKSKGFDAVEPDNIDGYTNSSGFPLKSSDQITYNKWIADTVHALGMSVALKNDGDQVGTLLQYFDFDINEQCVQYSECSNLTPFVSAGKAVFEAEYSSGCGNLNSLNMNGIRKNINLTAPVTECR